VPPDFLNSREDAILVWAVIILGFVLSKDPRGIGGSFLSVLRGLLHLKLLLLFGSALVYTAAVVYAAARFGLWHAAALKETVYWFFGAGVVLVGGAVSRPSTTDADFIRRVLRRVIAVTVFIEFAANLYAFPLAIELVAVFVVVLFSGMQVAAQYDSSVIPAARRFIDGILTVVGFCFLVYFVVRALTDLDGFLTRENAEDFLVGPVLTVALIPFLYGVAWISRREQQTLRKRFRARLDSPT
jgi:hypothetical protein